MDVEFVSDSCDRRKTLKRLEVYDTLLQVLPVTQDVFLIFYRQTFK